MRNNTDNYRGPTGTPNLRETSIVWVKIKNREQWIDDTNRDEIELSLSVGRSILFFYVGSISFRYKSQTRDLGLTNPNLGTKR